MFIQIEKGTLILNNGGKKSFSFETKILISFIPTSGMSLQYPIIKKKKEIITWICVYPNWQTNFDSKKWWEEKCFLWNQSISIIYPNEKNEFMLPNHEKKVDYYVNLCSSNLTNKLRFWKMLGRKVFVTKLIH